ncbi:uncharacterized protein K444DRAFT_545242, partial [Hyaloscypha bicolor E]
ITYKTRKQIYIMVWVSFWDRGKRYSLFILFRDFKSAKFGYITNSYIEVLENRLLDSYYNGLIFI